MILPGQTGPSFANIAYCPAYPTIIVAYSSLHCVACIQW